MVNVDDKVRIIIQTPFQLETMQKAVESGTFGIDSTHCTTRYGFFLTSVHMITPTHGIPVAHMISCDETEETIDILTKFLAPKMKAKDITLISDDYPAYVNSWTKNIGKPHHVQCLWHLKKNWRKNLKKNGITGMDFFYLISMVRGRDEKQYKMVWYTNLFKQN